MSAKMAYSYTLFIILACVMTVGSREHYNDHSIQPLPVEVQSKYINSVIKSSLSRQKRQSRSFFNSKLSGGRNPSPNAINDYSYSGNADFAFPGESYRPDNYPVENSGRNNQFGQAQPHSELNQGGFVNGLQNQQQNFVPQNTWQNTDNWLNPNFNYEGRVTNWWQNQINNNNWNSQLNSNQGWGQTAVETSTPAADNPRLSNQCQFECRKFVTGEYNPICGSDGVTYLNPGRFKCALKCGKQITGKPDKTCGLGAPVA